MIRTRAVWRRAATLLTWALFAAGYGAGILAGYRPTFTAALHLPVTVFGWMFLATAAISVTGVFTREDRWQFAVAELTATGWGLLLCTHWTQPYGWASGLSWVLAAVLLLVASSWPEPLPP